MGTPFDRLHFDPGLACEFLAVFARFEYALKAAGFALGDANKVSPDWDAYATTIDPTFTLLKDPAISAAVDYLLNQAPQKQVLDAGRNLQWKVDPPDAHLPR